MLANKNTNVAILSSSATNDSKRAVFRVEFGPSWLSVDLAVGLRLRVPEVAIRTGRFFYAQVFLRRRFS